MPWRKDAREEIARENELKADIEFGEMGLSRPFMPNEIIDLDKRLRITDYVVPEGGYRRSEASNGAEPVKDAETAGGPA